MHRVSLYPYYDTKKETPPLPFKSAVTKNTAILIIFVILLRRLALPLVSFLIFGLMLNQLAVFDLDIKFFFSSTYMDCGKISSCYTLGRNLLIRRLYTLFIRHPHGQMNYKDTEP